MNVNECIEYKIIKNLFIKYYLGIIEFELIDLNKMLVIYMIELQVCVFFVSKLIFVQFKFVIKLGFLKFVKFV